MNIINLICSIIFFKINEEDKIDPDLFNLTYGVIFSGVKRFMSFTILRALTPNITGIVKKNENSAAKLLDVPTIIAPKIVEPEREVPGMIDRT